MHLKINLLLLVVACVGYAVTEDTEPIKPIILTTTDKSTPFSTVHTAVTTAVHPTTAAETTAITTHSSRSTSGPTYPPTTQRPTDLWGAHYPNGSYCILLKATISIDFKYHSTVSKQTNTSRTLVPPPLNTTVNGYCGLDKQSIEIGFFNNWTLTLVFNKTNDGKYYQSEVHLAWNLKDGPFPDAPNIMDENSNLDPMFNTSKAGYLCTARMTLYENKTVENGLLAIYTEHLQLEAFQVKSEAKFSDQYERCKEDTISNLVPIIVGACLGGLIIIVLVAYLIGRKRSRRGYESV